MSLRSRINLIIAALLLTCVAALLWLQVQGTRHSVREEVEAASRVATQFLARVGWVYQQAGLGGMTAFLEQLGRVRANDVFLYDESGRLLYRSPPSAYKAGRYAPAWFAQLVGPGDTEHEVRLSSGRLIIRPDASRAILDGWDDLLLLLASGGVVFVLGNVLVFWAVGRAVAPLRTVMEGLARFGRGDFGTRLPPLPGREAAAMSTAFNDMARAVEESVSAREEAAETKARLERSRELARTIQEHVEAERLQIARELHDELSQSVTGIRSLALSLRQRCNGRDETAAQVAGLIADTAGQAYDAMHAIVARLRPMALELASLGEALDDLVNEWRLRYPEIRFDLELDAGALPADLPDSMTVTAYRVIQESLNNAVRHGHPTRVAVRCALEGGVLNLRVRDDGRGLETGATPRTGFGVSGMRERVEALGGVFEIGPGRDGGVQVGAAIPLHRPAAVTAAGAA